MTPSLAQTPALSDLLSRPGTRIEHMAANAVHSCLGYWNCQICSCSGPRHGRGCPTGRHLAQSFLCSLPPDLAPLPAVAGAFLLGMNCRCPEVLPICKYERLPYKICLKRFTCFITWADARLVTRKRARQERNWKGKVRKGNESKGLEAPQCRWTCKHRSDL